MVPSRRYLFLVWANIFILFFDFLLTFRSSLHIFFINHPFISYVADIFSLHVTCLCLWCIKLLI